MKNKKIGIIYGTRPEMIKLSPFIKLCQKHNVPFFCIHTGQHYSYEMDEIFFKELELPAPEYKLRIKSKAPYRQGEHTGRMLIEIEEILLREMPYCVVVQGDTNTAFAGALTAEKISTTESYTGFHIRVAHVEAGLRSFDRSMPEETNRFITDHLSDFLFVPTGQARKFLLKEGVPKSNIYITGNTIVDAVNQNISLAKKKSHILDKMKLEKNKYILLTLHRQENVDSKEVFTDIIKGLELVYRKVKAPIIFPMHYRTAKMLERFKLKMSQGVKVIAPLGFLDFICLEAMAQLVMTDSGGVQEETNILGVPCVTVRNNTERPETVAVGSNIVAGTKPGNILKAVRSMLARKRNWKNPFGDGKASQRMLDIILS